MEVVVLNGSPKSKYSVTMQYVKYLEKRFDEVDFQVIHVGKKINKIVKDEDYFLQIVDTISRSDAVMWAYPVYTCLVPYQLKKFIEMVVDRDLTSAFAGKYSTSISTSAHFYDHTAHNYVHGTSEDLGMNYIEGFSAAMFDLIEEDKRESLCLFFDRFLQYAREGLHVTRRYKRIENGGNGFEVGPVEIEPIKQEGRVVLLTDVEKEDKNLNQMIDVFVKSVPVNVDVCNINEIEIHGGCLGCIKCAHDGRCVYNDDFEEFVRDKINNADAFVFAGKMKGRYLSSHWKLFFDRSFFNGHRPVNKGKQIGFLISGPLSQESNFQSILRAIPEVGLMNMVDVVTDEMEEATEGIKQMGKDLCWAMENDFSRPENFLGVGGHKIFRDLIYNMGFVFSEDHRFYKKNGLYDFPQKDFKARMMNTFLRPMMAVPPVRKAIMEKAKEGMLMPFQKVMEQ